VGRCVGGRGKKGGTHQVVVKASRKLKENPPKERVHVGRNFKRILSKITKEGKKDTDTKHKGKWERERRSCLARSRG